MCKKFSEENFESVQQKVNSEYHKISIQFYIHLDDVVHGSLNFFWSFTMLKLLLFHGKTLQIVPKRIIYTENGTVTQML